MFELRIPRARFGWLPLPGLHAGQHPAAADPVCVKSSQHAPVTEAVERAAAQLKEHPLVFRDPANSRRLSGVVQRNGYVR